MVEYVKLWMSERAAQNMVGSTSSLHQRDTYIIGPRRGGSRLGSHLSQGASAAFFGVL